MANTKRKNASKKWYIPFIVTAIISLALIVAYIIQSYLDMLPSGLHVYARVSACILYAAMGYYVSKRYHCS